MYKGENGIDNLNIILQELFNPRDDRKEEVRIGEVTYRVGDKVLQLVNDPDNNIYNGDIGYVMSVNTKSKDELLTVDFYGNAVYYKREDLINLKHAYAITIHKSQGSEFDAVVIPVVGGNPMMMTRNLLYTAVTRAKKMVVLVGGLNHIAYMIHNEYLFKRKTLLKELIKDEYAKLSALGIFGE